MRKHRSLWLIALVAVLCATIIVGSTYAYYTDEMPTDENLITSGDLEVAFMYLDENGAWKNAENTTLFAHTAWEPNYAAMRYVKVQNTGDMAFQYELNVVPTLVPEDGVNLMDVIDVYFGVVENPGSITRANFKTRLTKAGTMTELLTNAHGAGYGLLLPVNGSGTLPENTTAHTGEVTACIVLHMQETAGNEYMGANAGDGFKLQLVATQYTWESDAFGNLFASDATLPDVEYATSKTIAVTPDQNGCVPYDIVFESNTGVTAVVPKGAKMEAGARQLILIVYPKAKSDANLSLKANEVVTAWEVKVEGLADDNTVPVRFALPEAMPKGLNIGNYALYHVENGLSVPMTRVEEIAAESAHNSFTYNPATGDMGLAMATFSEVAIVSNEENAWNGEFDYTWYTNATELTIANADQLAAFGAIVGGMDGQTQNSFSGKTVKLISDINLGDTESENKSNIIFYPIGYYNSEGTYERTNTAITSGLRNFEGTFDGNGHTISNFYQNTWEMKGDNNYYDAKLQYYRDGMGLFGKVYGGAVKNLTVSNFSSDGEYTTTGVIAAYADGATFENIAVTNCNPRVYNIGNGGIVGCVGWYAKEAGLKTTFKNITVDNSNKISALWGSYDVACGGIVGQYYPTSGQTSAGSPKNAGIDFANCHVSAQMDVYNDVCGNYQYYAYRYAGMMIGSIRENETINGYVYPKMDDITASGCTVHFGDWNDYYYCELVANSLASYTHDHQFSRLEQVQDVNGTTITYLDGTTGTVPSSGRYNYVVVNGEHATDNAKCYHFVDGAVWNHEDAGKETVNGAEVLKEDKQHIYLEFDQLFTGYGWGVTSKGIKDYPEDQIKILDRKVPDSCKKFEKADTAKDSYTTGTTVAVGELFKAAKIEDEKLTIKGDNVKVFVSPVGEGSSADGAYAVDTSDWKKGTLTFYGKGKANVTITDYYYCKPCTITVEIKDTGILYRVGNQNEVTYAQIAKLLTKKESYSSIAIERCVGEVAFTETDANVQFTGTGLVKVEIDSAQYYLEVVDAKNVTVKADATANNVVLLNDISGGFTVSNGYAFYGNGFKVTCSGDGSYRSAAVSYGFVTVDEGGILDNVQIICDIFPESYLYTREMKAGSDGRYPYGYSAVVISGNSTISNSYIYGARNNIQVGEGNVIIKNTVTECGSLSNIHIKSNDSNTVTLEDVTTIQYQTTSKYDTSKTTLGFGVLVGTNESASNAKIELKGDFRQYNWVTDSDTNVSNSYAKTAISEALKVTAYQHTINGKNTVNMGIVYLNQLKANIVDGRDNGEKILYSLSNITMTGKTGQVYSIVGSGITADDRYDAHTDKIIPYTPNKNEPIMPSLKYEESNNAIVTTYEYTDETWQGKVAVDLDKITSGSYDFMFSNLTVLKYGKELEFMVVDSNENTMDMNKAITLNQLVTQEYVLIVTDNQIYDAQGTLTDETIQRKIPFVLNATKTSIDPPKFTNAGTATAIRLVSSKGGEWRPAYTVLTGVSVTYWSASESKVKTVDLSSLYNSGTISSNVWTYTCDDYTLTITGGQVHSDGTTITPVVANNTLYFASTNKAFGTGTTSRNIILTYVFTDKNASTTWNRTETVTYSDLSEYDYNSFKNGTLKEPSSGGGTSCLAAGTLITMQDGSKRAVEDLRKGDAVMAFDHLTGNVTSNKVIIVVKTESDFYQNTFVFDDGTELVTINEHGIYDLNLNRYVNIDHLNADEYIGHDYVAIDAKGQIGTKKLVAVNSEYMHGYKYDIVTEGTLNYVAEDTLSVTHVLVDIINTFDFDDSMRYDQEKMEADIQKYGLYSFEEWQGRADIKIFEEYNIPVMKVGVSKGMYTENYILSLINTFVLDENVQIID